MAPLSYLEEHTHMPFQLKTPARINILGNRSDANEGDFATITAAVNLYAHATIEKAESIILEQIEKDSTGKKNVVRQEFSISEIPLPYNGTLDLI